MSRRSLIIIGIALAIILLSGGVIWYLYSGGGRSFFGRWRVPTPVTLERTRRPEAERGPLITITSGAAYFPVITQDGEVRYLAEDGSLWKTGLHARSEARLLLGVPQGIQKLVWAPGGEQALAWRQDAEGTKVILANFVSGETRELFPDISEVSWSPDGQNFLALGQSAEQAQTLLQLFRADGSRPQTLLTLPRVDLTVHWLNKDAALLWERPTARAPSAVFRFDIRTRSLQLFKPERTAFELTPSPTEGSFLYSFVSNGVLQQIVLADLSGKETGLPIRTPASKCVFTQNARALICAESVSAQGDFPAVNDRLLRYEIASDLTSPLQVPADVALEISSPLLSLDERYLVFVNRGDGKLWSLALAGL